MPRSLLPGLKYSVVAAGQSTALITEDGDGRHYMKVASTLKSGDQYLVCKFQRIGCPASATLHVHNDRIVLRRKHTCNVVTYGAKYVEIESHLTFHLSSCLDHESFQLDMSSPSFR